MATVAELRARREALLKLIGDGVRVEQYDGHRLEYQSLAEMERAVARIDRELAAVGGGSGVRRRMKIVVTKDL